MKQKRLFLISKQTKNHAHNTTDHVIILGYIESGMYPSHLVNDQELARKRYGYDYLTITEITEKCHINFI